MPRYVSGSSTFSIHSEVADQVEALEDEPDFAVANARAIRERQILRPGGRQDVLPFGRRIQQAENRQQRRLAAARRTGDGDVLAFLDVQMDAGECMRFDFVGVENLGHVFKID